MTVTVTAEFADSLDELKEMLQALRGWERARESIGLKIAVDARGFDADDMVAVLRSIDPPFPVMWKSGRNVG